MDLRLDGFGMRLIWDPIGLGPDACETRWVWPPMDLGPDEFGHGWIWKPTCDVHQLFERFGGLDGLMLALRIPGAHGFGGIN